jgi:hypothetical protein
MDIPEKMICKTRLDSQETFLSALCQLNDAASTPYQIAHE